MVADIFIFLSCELMELMELYGCHDKDAIWLCSLSMSLKSHGYITPTPWLKDLNRIIKKIHHPYHNPIDVVSNLINCFPFLLSRPLDILQFDKYQMCLSHSIVLVRFFLGYTQTFYNKVFGFNITFSSSSVFVKTLKRYRRGKELAYKADTFVIINIMQNYIKKLLQKIV